MGGNMRKVNLEEEYSLYVDFDDNYNASLFNLIIKGGELVIVDEDGRRFWFINRSQKGLNKFIADWEERIGQKHSKVWVEDSEGKKVDLNTVSTRGAPI
jgi:hypothetical protein